MWYRTFILILLLASFRSVTLRGPSGQSTHKKEQNQEAARICIWKMGVATRVCILHNGVLNPIHVGADSGIDSGSVRLRTAQPKADHSSQKPSVIFLQARGPPESPFKTKERGEGRRQARRELWFVQQHFSLVTDECIFQALSMGNAFHRGVATNEKTQFLEAVFLASLRLAIHKHETQLDWVAHLRERCSVR